MIKLMDIGAASFASEVLDSTTPVVVEFYTQTCKFCKRFEPVVESVADKYEDKVKFCRINAAENREIAIQYDIFGVPATLIFRNGEVVERISGFVPEEELSRKIDGVLG